MDQSKWGENPDEGAAGEGSGSNLPATQPDIEAAPRGAEPTPAAARD